MSDRPFAKTTDVTSFANPLSGFSQSHQFSAAAALSASRAPQTWATRAFALLPALALVIAAAPVWAESSQGSNAGHAAPAATKAAASGGDGHGAAPMVAGSGLCEGFGPQTPRDISLVEGRNQRAFTLAPPASDMNLCNIHMHTNAEHRGPGFAISAGSGDHGGYMCNNSQSLTQAELSPSKAVSSGHKGMAGVKPGDTIEVHWVFSSCAVNPGKGLGSCVSDTCANPELRVESQVFLVVNDPNALDFNYFTYGGNRVGGLHQPKELPGGTGTPVLFAGSTTGPSYTQQTCSPYQVTWSVRPNCAKVDIQSIHEWADSGNVFEEDHSHGVRQLVTAPELLSQIR